MASKTDEKRMANYEALKAYIKSGEKIIKLEKDFADDTNGSV